MNISQITPNTVTMVLEELNQKISLPLISIKILNPSLAVLSRYKNGDLLRQDGDGKIFKDEHRVNLFRSRVGTEAIRDILLTALFYLYKDRNNESLQPLKNLKANYRAAMRETRGLDRMVQDYSRSFWTKNQGSCLKEIYDEVKKYERQLKKLSAKEREREELAEPNVSEDREIALPEVENEAETPLTPPSTPVSQHGSYESSPRFIVTVDQLQERIKKMGRVIPSGRVNHTRRKSETHMDELHASLIQERKALEASVLKPTVEPCDDLQTALRAAFIKFKPLIERANDGVFEMDRDEKDWEQPPMQDAMTKNVTLLPVRPPLLRTASDFKLGLTPEVRVPKPQKEDIAPNVIQELSEFLRKPLELRRRSIKMS